MIYMMIIIYFLLYFFFLILRRPPSSTRTYTLFPYTPLFRSVTVRLLWMSIVWSPGDFSSLPTSSVSLLRTTRLKSFWAWKKTSSASFLSSKRSSLNPLPPLLELLLIVDWVALAGRAAGGLLSPLYTRPVMIGRSGSPSRNSTITSCPIRGMNIPPQDLPAHTWATRTQQELFSLFVPSRSQWNWSFTPPCSSVQISSPALPTTMAVCGPLIVGFDARSDGRNEVALGMAPMRQRKMSPSGSSEDRKSTRLNSRH